MLVAPILNNALRFNGSSQYARRNNASTVNDNFSMVMWLRVLSYGAGNVFLFQNGANDARGIALYMTSAGVLHGDIAFVADVNSSYTLLRQTWYQVAWIRSSGTSQLYVNAIARGSTSASSPNAPGSGDWITLAAWTSSGGTTNGNANIDIADARFYERAISVGELRNLFAGKEISKANVKFWYQFNESVGTNVRDTTTTGYNLTTSGSPAWLKGQVKLASQIKSILGALLGSSFSQTLSETTTLTDSILKQAQKKLSETITHTDSILKLIAKTFTETQTSTDTLNKQTSKPLSETVTHTDTITTLKVTVKTLLETVTHSDTLTKLTSKVLSETATLTASIIRFTQRTFTETTTLTDTLVRSTSRIFSETITYTDSLLRTAKKTLSETITHTDTVIATRLGAAYSKILSETVSFTDTLVRLIGKVLTETLSLTDTVKKLLNGLSTFYSDKFASRGTSYGNKYSSRGTSYGDKYSNRGTSYSDKYSQRNL